MDKNWQKIATSPDTAMSCAIEQLSKTGKTFLIVVDAHQRLIGTVTDSDIREGVLKFKNLEIPVSEIMNKHPTSVPTNSTPSEILEIFNKTRMRALPAVESSGKIHGYFLRSSFSEQTHAKNELVIMAGGFGKRMGELTKKIPKPMIEINGQPMLEIIIEKAKKQGFEKFTISVHFLAQKIISYFGDGSRFGVEIDYVKEEEPLGTAGSLRHLKDGDGPVVIINCDVISDVNLANLRDFHILTNAYATLGTHEYTMENPYGVVHAEGTRVVSIEEKPKWSTNINAGIYVFNRSVKNKILNNEKIDMPALIHRLLSEKKLVVQYPIHERLYEVGSTEKYLHYANGADRLTKNIKS